MEQIVNYVKPELLIVAAALYFLGMWLKQSQAVKDKYIPLLLGAAGIVICALWLTASGEFHNVQDVVMVIFASVTQGILVAGLSTYVNQIVKQMNKEE